MTWFFIGLKLFLLFKCNIAHYLKTWCQFDLILSILVGTWEISTLKLNLFLGCSLIIYMQGVVKTTIHDLCLIKCLKILYCMECCAKWFSYCRNILELFLEIKIVCMSKCWSWNPKSKFMVSDKLFSTYCYFLYIKSYKFYLHISLLVLLVILEIKISPFCIILAMNHKPTYYLIDN